MRRADKGGVSRDRVDGDPVGAEKPRGKSRYQRKSARDGKSWTPTESRHRDQLMRQFCRLDGPAGASEAYVSSPVWCPCGKRMHLEGTSLCRNCFDAWSAAGAPMPPNQWMPA